MSHENELSPDAVFELLSNPRRRFIIAFLRQADEPVDIKEFVRQIAALENGVPLDELTDSQEKRIHVSLYQTHIPKLEDAGVLEYDPDWGLVTPGDAIRDVERYVPKHDVQRVPWKRVYATVALAAFGVYAVSFLNVGALAHLTTATSSFLVVAGFVTVVMAQFLIGELYETSAPVPLITPNFPKE